MMSLVWFFSPYSHFTPDWGLKYDIWQFDLSLLVQQNGEASLFEVNIRYVGGLLSAYYLTGEEVRLIDVCYPSTLVRSAASFISHQACSLNDEQAASEGDSICAHQCVWVYLCVTAVQA